MHLRIEISLIAKAKEPIQGTFAELFEPTLLLGGGAFGLKGGRHLVYPEHTPLTNFQLTHLTRLTFRLRSWAIAPDSSKSCLSCPDLLLDHGGQAPVIIGGATEGGPTR